MTFTTPRRIEDVAVFLAWQPTPDYAPYFGKPFELWNITEDITPALVKGSTMNRSVIENALNAEARR